MKKIYITYVLLQLGHFLVSKKGQIKYIFNEGRLITSKKIKRSQAKYRISRIT